MNVDFDEKGYIKTNVPRKSNHIKPIEETMQFDFTNKRNTHKNSYLSHEKTKPEKPNRKEMIYNTLSNFGKLTDRQIQEALCLPDINGVRPRITELIKEGVLKECGNIYDNATQRTVRIIGINFDEVV